MSTRSMRRTKVVLPVTVIRSNGEKKLAHTLDVTLTSARLGGLCTSVDPGEVIEIQRGASKAKFQIMWVGASNSVLVGQAGAQGLFTGRNVWGVDIPADLPDVRVNTEELRSRFPITTTGSAPGERRWHPRAQCAGSASVLAHSMQFPVYGELHDLSLGGVYVATAAAYPVNTRVTLKMSVAGVTIDLPGTVRTSDAQVGMGIGFQRGTKENEAKLALAVESLERAAQLEAGRPAPVAGTLRPLVLAV